MHIGIVRSQKNGENNALGIKADIIPSFLYRNAYTAVNSGKEGKKHMAEEFKSINTQEDFDARIKERLERAEKAVKKSFDGWTSPDDLKAIQAKHEEELKKLKNDENGRKMQAKNILISSLISLGVIVLGTIGFSIYLRFFSRYSNLYGSLAGLVVFLLWVYISMFGLVLAPTFNKWFSMRKL